MRDQPRRRRDPMYTAVCDRCSHKTWFKEEQPCNMSYAVPCPTCHQRTEKQRRCPGTLRLVDRSGLAKKFESYFESQQRIRVRFSWDEDGSDTKTGTVSMTGGWRPSYMLMLRSDSMGSSDLLGEDDIILAAKRGDRYVQVYHS